MNQHDTEDGRLFHLAEECSEVIQAICKMGRFGTKLRHASNGIDKETGENITNVEVVLRGLDNLISAIEKSRPDLVKELNRIRKEEDREVVAPTRRSTKESEPVGEEPGRETSVPPVRVCGDGEDQPS